MQSDKEKVIEEKRKTTIDNPEFEIVWEGQPSGLWGTILTTLHLNFTWYKLSKDELIITTGFFNRRTNSVELYLLKDPDLTVNLYQRIIGVGTITALIDTHSGSARAGQKVVLRNVQEAEKVRKLLRDSIEADVMERKITYFDKV